MTSKFLKGILMSFVILLFISCEQEPKTPNILVFSKTAGFRHESIPAGIEAIKKIGAKNGYHIDATEDASLITEDNLSQYHVVVFLNTTMDILDKTQQNDFERFIQSGGGFVGVHAATDTEYNWPWYNGLVGAYFANHPGNPNVRTAEFDKNTEYNDHPALDSIPDRFSMTDEFYNFKSMSSDLNVLFRIDETSYEGGTNGDDHPMSWFHEYDGGRAFYTALGHTNEMYENPLFIKHLNGGIKYALGDKLKLPDYSKALTMRVPTENRFNRVVLDQGLNEPIELAVLPDERVLFIQRKGEILIYEPEKKATRQLHKLEVSHKYIGKTGEGEDGLLGLAIDPDFTENGWVYMYHSLAGDRPVNVLTRWHFDGENLDTNSMKIVLEVDVQRNECCHTGGSIAFDSAGNLYLSTSDNTNPFGTAYAPIDEREGRSPWDAQKGTSNTNDLRGKIIRITPQDDGTYTIPEGNLFPEGTPNTRPEIYGMGTRNAYRISVDQKTGYVYWGDVGPDANVDSVGAGPRGYDEVNQLKEPGFFGWPYFIGNNFAYYDYNFETEKAGSQFDPEKPINDSPNNTGLTELPPAQPAFIYYPYANSEEFPLVGTGARNAMAGPVYYKDMFEGAERPFPDYYDGKLLIYDWMRGWIMAVTMDEQGDFVEMERFMPNYKFNNPIDMEFGPNGDLYILEYGTGWFLQNDNSYLVRIEYSDGNRKPIVMASVDKPDGDIPHSVTFSSEGTMDYDGDQLSYEWFITDQNGGKITTLKGEHPEYTFEKEGVYNVLLKVDDGEGETAEANLEIIAGNEPPEVALTVAGNNEFFFPGIPVSYQAKVNDKEDGNIEGDQFAFSIDFLDQGYDLTEITQGHQESDELSKFAVGKNLVEENDCKSCHKVNEKSIGPSYKDIGVKYNADAEAPGYLLDKIKNGGGGVWGETAMAAHPDLDEEDIKKMVSYILSLGSETEKEVIPTEGTYTITKDMMKPGQGALVMRAAYQDQGKGTLPSIMNSKTLVLKAPTVKADEAVEIIDADKRTFNQRTFIIANTKDGGASFGPLDLTGVESITFSASAPQQFGFQGGFIEVYLNGPEGKLIGVSEKIKPSQNMARGTSINVNADIEAQSGKQLLYLKFKNDSGESGNLFSLISFDLIPQDRNVN